MEVYWKIMQHKNGAELGGYVGIEFGKAIKQVGSNYCAPELVEARILQRQTLLGLPQDKSKIKYALDELYSSEKHTNKSLISAAQARQLLRISKDTFVRWRRKGGKCYKADFPKPRQVKTKSVLFDRAEILEYRQKLRRGEV